jgi:nitrite reductase/ring-hydroxylating ferredoxin subunit
MSIELKSPINNELFEKIQNGHYFIFNDFTKKQQYYDSVKQIILDGIEEFEGSECRQAIEKNGLTTMHNYFPVDKLIYLDVFIREQARQLLIELAYSFCKDDLKLTSEFFIAPDDFFVKVSYPFEVAIKSTVNYEQYIEYKNKRLNTSQPLKVKEVLRKLKAKAKKLLKKSKVEAGYHGGYPYAANVFGPHLDSWYAAPLDEINLWWAIEGVTEDNSVILYPESFGESIKYKKEFLYISPGITLTKPYKAELQNGSILVFNSDLLHGSHLNVSNVTRIAIAPRVTLHKPKFNRESLDDEFSGWYSSQDIAREEFGKLIKFPLRENWGVLHEGRQKPHVEKRISITVNSTLSEVRQIALCPSDTLNVGEKMLVNLNNESLVVLRTLKGLQAVSALCPHIKINLIDGFHDEQHIYCPGHGVAFSLTDGSSKCNLLKLQVYKAYDHKGKIFIEQVVSGLDTQSDNKAIHDCVENSNPNEGKALETLVNKD